MNGTSILMPCIAVTMLLHGIIWRGHIFWLRGVLGSIQSRILKCSPVLSASEMLLKLLGKYTVWRLQLQQRYRGFYQSGMSPVPVLAPILKWRHPRIFRTLSIRHTHCLNFPGTSLKRPKFQVITHHYGKGDVLQSS